MTITDICVCGAKFEVKASDSDAFGHPNHQPEYQHNRWLEAHKVCRQQRKDNN